MLIVALTGGIATGKSIVAGILRSLGCYIHSADEAAHELMEPGKPAWKKIVSHFDPTILNPDKTINRPLLGRIVFSSRKERKFLNDLIHPLVMKKKKETIGRLEKEGRHQIFISEAALTIEAGFVPFFDKIIIVTCDEKTQVRRLMERDKITRASAIKKIKSQMPAGKKLEYADYRIDTSGNLQQTREQTEEVFRNLLLDYEKKTGKSE